MANPWRTIRVRFAGDASGLAAASTVGGKSLSKWRDGLSKVDESFKTTEKVSGQATDKVNDNLAKVDSRIAVVRDRLAKLNATFAETGDIKLFADMSRDRTLLANLERVRKDLDVTTKHVGREGGDNLRTGLSGGFLAAAKRMVKGAANLGANMATKITEKIPGALGGALSALPPQAQVAIVGGIAAALIAGSSVIGAALSGALLAGLGAGVLAGGIALAIGDHRVAAAGSKLGGEIKEDLQDAASAFLPPMMRSIGIARNAWRDIRPDVKAAFAEVAPYTDDMARGLADAARRFMPGFLAAVRQVGPVLTMLAGEFSDLGAVGGQFFRDLGENANGARMGLKLMLDLLENTILVTGKVLSSLSATYERLTLVGEFLTGDVAGAWAILASHGDTLNKTTRETGLQFERLSEAQQREITAAGSGSVALQGYRDRLQLVNGSLLGAIEKTGSFAAALDVLNGKTMTAREAQRNYQAAIDAVGESIKTNGRSLDDNTAKGRANNQTLDNLANSAKANAAAIYEQTAQTGNTTLAQAKATKAWQDGRAELIKAYRQFDNNKGRAEAYADAVMGIPTSWTTTPKFDDSAATAKLKSFAKRINTLDGRVITVYTRETKLGEYIPGQGTQLRRWGGIDYAMAGGGTIAAHFRRSPTVLYGERETGGEAFIPRRGNLRRSRSIAETVVRDWLGGDVSWATRRTAPMPTSGGRTGGGALAVTNQVYLDGQPFYAYTSRAVASERQRERWRQTVGER
ncbi:hypothetical protein AB0N38_10500 [Micromonospora aurantiaca]|uniref:hypothetical protein n=1 Tax=Micromonospora aurantiaca (nom. illeg.) TaxID=47850 RepID=UPI00342DF796